MYKTLKIKVEGIAPLIMHSSNLANPLHPITKEIKNHSGKRGKTEDDLELLAKLEWCGGLYLDKPIALEVSGNDVRITSDAKVGLPPHVLEAAILEGAKKDKLGKQFKAGLFVESFAYLNYGKLTNGTHTQADELNALLHSDIHRNVTLMRVQNAKILRTRPQFMEWDLDFEIHYIPNVLDERQIINAIEKAGTYAGFGDSRPRYGRFRIADK